MSTDADTASSSTSPVSQEAMLRAVERRAQVHARDPNQYAQQQAEHEKKQAFRRLIDPGIMRPNSYEQAVASLKTLLTIAENLLNEPDNPKYRQFKQTNSIIQKNLVEPKGTLEYAIELGFRPEVKDFQPYYVFNPRHMDNLRIGTAIIKEVFERETQKLERASRARKEEKEAVQAAAEKVKLAFMDDRRSKELADERERAARAARMASPRKTPRRSTEQNGEEDEEDEDEGEERPRRRRMRMPGTGHVLAGDDDEESVEAEETNYVKDKDV